MEDKTKYAKWCTTKFTETGLDIETGEVEEAELEATVGEITANIAADSSKIEDLAASIAQDEGDLKSAESIRTGEMGTFKSSEAELLDSIETLSRAIPVLEREMSKNPAALVQVDGTSMQSIVKSMSAI